MYQRYIKTVLLLTNKYFEALNFLARTIKFPWEFSFSHGKNAFPWEFWFFPWEKNSHGILVFNEKLIDFFIFCLNLLQVTLLKGCHQNDQCKLPQVKIKNKKNMRFLYFLKFPWEFFPMGEHFSHGKNKIPMGIFVFEQIFRVLQNIFLMAKVLF